MNNGRIQENCKTSFNTMVYIYIAFNWKYILDSKVSHWLYCDRLNKLLRKLNHFSLLGAFARYRCRALLSDTGHMRNDHNQFQDSDEYRAHIYGKHRNLITTMGWTENLNFQIFDSKTINFWSSQNISCWSLILNRYLLVKRMGICKKLYVKMKVLSVF